MNLLPDKPGLASQTGHAVPDGRVLDNQYSLRRILGIWAAVALPMLLSYGFLPAWISRYTGVADGLAVFFVIIGGLVWQFAVGLFILKREIPTWSWPAISRRLRLNKPINPRSGKASNLYLLVGFLSALLALGAGSVTFLLDDFMVSVLPEGLINDRSELFDLIGPGDYWAIGLFLFSSIYNYLLGEEFIFRGILLPKMEGRFGRYDWLANGVLFAFYHLHLMYVIPSLLVITWANALAAKYYRREVLSPRSTIAPAGLPLSGTASRASF